MNKDEFTAAEAAVVRNAVDDWAAVYYGGPFGLTETSAVRYVTEGHLDDLCAKRGRDAVWQAVADRIAEDRSVLEASPEQRQRRRTQRRERASQLLTEARAAYDEGDHARALAVVDEAELVEPGYQTPEGVTYERIRQTIGAAQAASPGVSEAES